MMDVPTFSPDCPLLLLFPCFIFFFPPCVCIYSRCLGMCHVHMMLREALASRMLRLAPKNSLCAGVILCQEWSSRQTWMFLFDSCVVCLSLGNSAHRRLLQERGCEGRCCLFTLAGAQVMKCLFTSASSQTFSVNHSQMLAALWYSEIKLAFPDPRTAFYFFFFACLVVKARCV